MKLAPQEVRTYLLTAVTAQRRRLFQVSDTAEMFLATIEAYRARGRFALHAFVVMPEHVHLLVTPAPEVALEKVAQLIKGGFSFRLKSVRDVWERGYDGWRAFRCMSEVHRRESSEGADGGCGGGLCV